MHYIKVIESLRVAAPSRGLTTDGRCVRCGRRNQFVGPLSRVDGSGRAVAYYECSTCGSMILVRADEELAGITDS